MTGAGDLSFRWNDPEDVAHAAAFAGAVIGAAPAYISHGEIQVGLSDDGKSWAEDLTARYATDFAVMEGRDMLVARDDKGQIAALLIVAYEESPRRKFAVIEDMAVSPALRGRGIGARLMAMAQDRIRARKVDWVFLESGIRNEEAHHFFEREGFQAISHVFARRLSR